MPRLTDTCVLAHEACNYVPCACWPWESGVAQLLLEHETVLGAHAVPCVPGQQHAVQHGCADGDAARCDRHRREDFMKALLLSL